MQTLLNRSANAKAKFAALRKNGLVASLRSGEVGAIDLASIMVGVIVIGIIGGVIAATVFAVIPWAQDEAAKGTLDSVKQAQAVAYAFEVSENGGAATHLSEANLVAEGFLPTQLDELVILTPVSGSGYDAYVLSGSNKVFQIDETGALTEYDDLADLNTAITPAVGEFTVVSGVLTFTPAP